MQPAVAGDGARLERRAVAFEAQLARELARREVQRLERQPRALHLDPAGQVPGVLAVAQASVDRRRAGDARAREEGAQHAQVDSAGDRGFARRPKAVADRGRGSGPRARRADRRGGTGSTSSTPRSNDQAAGSASAERPLDRPRVEARQSAASGEACERQRLGSQLAVERHEQRRRVGRLAQLSIEDPREIDVAQLERESRRLATLATHDGYGSTRAELAPEQVRLETLHAQLAACEGRRQVETVPAGALETSPHVREPEAPRERRGIARAPHLQLQLPGASQGPCGERRAESLAVQVALQVEIERARRREPDTAVRREPGLSRVEPQPRKLERRAVSAERERRDAPVQAPDAPRDGEVGAGVAQPRRLAQRQLDGDRAARRERRVRLRRQLERVQQRLKRQRLRVDLEPQRPVALEPGAPLHDRVRARAGDAQLATVGASRERQRGQRRSVERHVRERQLQVTHGMRRAPGDGEPTRERPADASGRSGNERKALPAETGRLERRLEHVRRRIVVPGSREAPPGKIGLKALDPDVTPRARGLELEYHVVRGARGFRTSQARRRAQRRASDRLVAPSCDTDGAGGRAAPLEPDQGEGRVQLEGVDLAGQVPLPARDERDPAGERRLSRARAQDEWSHREAASLVSQLGFEPQRTAAQDQILPSHSRRDERGPDRTREVAFRQQAPLDLGRARGLTEIGKQRGAATGPAGPRSSDR